MQYKDLLRGTVLLVAIPEGIDAGVVTARARKLNPGLRIVARAHSDDERADLARYGADRVVLAEDETAARMVEHCLGRRLAPTGR